VFFGQPARYLVHPPFPAAQQEGVEEVRSHKIRIRTPSA
jgi:hypothetical protein